MSNIFFIGPLHQMECLIHEKIAAMMQATELHIEHERYDFMSLVLDSCTSDKKIQDNLKYTVSSTNGGMTEDEVPTIIPGIIKAYIDKLKKNKVNDFTIIA